MENDPKAFVFWLQGFFELSNPSTLDEQQVQIIKEHLALVLQKTTSTSYFHDIQSNIKVNLPTFTTYPTGPQCGVCNRICSEEGGICKKCRNTTTTSDLPIVDVPTCLTC